MKINTIFISIDGSCENVEVPKNNFFNNIGEYLTNNKSDKLESKIIYYDKEKIYELIFCEKSNLNNLYNIFISNLLNEEIYGNVVIICSTKEIISINDLSIINKIRYQKRNIQFFKFTKNKIQNYNLFINDIKPFLINNFKNTYKQKIIEHYKIYGYEINLFYNNESILNHPIIKILCNDFIIKYLKSKKKSEEKSEEKSEDKLEEKSEEKSEEKLEEKSEEKLEEKSEEKSEEDKLFIFNKLNNSFINLSFEELKKILYISTLDLDIEEKDKIQKYINSLSDENINFEVKNRYEELNNVYTKLCI